MIRRWPPDNTLMYKIPRRQIWCTSIGSWLKELTWVFIAHKIWGDYIHQLVGDPMEIPNEGDAGEATA